ncbi:hypothetical protein GGI07_003599 [Coemansia sp. Benny D115]|nr:hypothetical protein GGI07_003599 [Coemansia sp. Benny D115]
MSNPTSTNDGSGSSSSSVSKKTETAQLIAQWATHELGFRKESTLVTAKGEERITAADIEPLLQGELATILELSATHLVSSQRASHVRSTLAAYCTQPTNTTAPRSQNQQHPTARVALQKDLLKIQLKEKHLAEDIASAELENQEAIRIIDDLNDKRSAAESRIRELRLQILAKQTIAEKTSRISRSMRVLTREMSASTCGPLTGLEDSYLELRESVSALTTRLGARKQELIKKLDTVSGKLNTEAMSQGSETRDFRDCIVQLVIEDAVTRVKNQTRALVSKLVPLPEAHWVSGDLNDKDSRAADKLVTRSSQLESERRQLIDHVVQASTGNVGQAHEVVVARIAERLIQGLHQVHIMSKASDEQLESYRRVEELVEGGQGGRALAQGGGSLEAIVDALCQRSSEQRGMARVVTNEWQKKSNGQDSLQISKESGKVEQAIVELSDTSGHLFTEPFAPWYEKNGLTHAECLKRLKIKRASK